MTYGLVHLALYLTLFFGRHVLRPFPIVIVEPLGVSVIWLATLRLIVGCIRIIDIPEDFSRTPTLVLGIIASTLGHRDPTILSVLLNDLTIDVVVHCDVGGARTYLPQMRPRYQVTIHLVEHLVYHDEP